MLRSRPLTLAPARESPGVVAVYTAAELGLVPLWEIAIIPPEFAQPPLATDTVRYVGERVVAVVAESLAEALDGAELVQVEYKELPVVGDVDAAVGPDAPILFPEAGSNVCLDWTPEPGNVGGLVEANVRHVIPRVCPAPLEGHSVLAVPDAEHLTMYLSTQVPVAARRQIARTLSMSEEHIRVVVPAVGGGFGGKAAGANCDHAIVGAAAQRLGRSVRYVEDRTDNLTEMHGRGVQSEVRLRATSDGRLLELESHILCDAGAYPNVGSVEPGKTAMVACGPYRFGSARVEARSVVTNRSPTVAYRGPGRSEASIMLERTLDVLAQQLSIDPVEIRRRNLIASDQFPYATPTGLSYDSGNYQLLLDRLMEVVDYPGLRAEQARRRAADDGPLLGIGVSTIVDSTAWFARTESAAVGVNPDGTVEVKTGSAAAGQRHERVYRKVVRRLLPVPDQQIRVIEGDTAKWDLSEGSMGSRTAQLAGAAVAQATEKLVDQLRQRASEQLEAAVGDIEILPDARFAVRGVPARACSLAQLIALESEPLEISCTYQQSDATYPSAAHLSLVEVDTDTGAVTALRHVAVTDCGTVLDPPSAHGQVVGATAQAIGQALSEEAIHDRYGNPLSASFVSYGIPSACEIPQIESHFVETPSPRNPLGAKGVGEIGMIAGPVAVQNAVVDALVHLGVRHLDMPCTPEKVWAALRAGRDQELPSAPGSD